MENNLFPEDIDNELVDLEDENETEVTGYKLASYFDFNSGDFVLNGKGQIITADGVTGYTQWCETVLATDRYNHESYTTDIGIDFNQVFAASSREEAETILESEITEALECDPYGRTQYVQNVICEWIGPDTVEVTVDVVALDNEIVTINKTLSK